MVDTTATATLYNGIVRTVTRGKLQVTAGLTSDTEKLHAQYASFQNTDAGHVQFAEEQLSALVLRIE